MIYLIEQSEKYKIGYTNDILKRMLQYETHNYDFKLLYVIKGDKQLEHELHKRFSNLKVRSEWFDIDNSILDYFKSNGTYVGYSSTDKNNNNSEEPDDDEELWLKLYVGTYFTAIGKIKSATEMKIFAACLLFAEKTDDNGCVIMPSKSSFRNALQKDCNISQQNLHRALKHLCDFGLLQKITRFEYRINPQIAYLGDKRSRAELILKIVKE